MLILLPHRRLINHLNAALARKACSHWLQNLVAADES